MSDVPLHRKTLTSEDPSQNRPGFLPSLTPITGDGLHMAFSPTQASQQGGCLLAIVFTKETDLPRDVVYFLAFDGRRRRHLTPAQRISQNKMSAYVPPHGSAEAVTLKVLMYRHGGYRVLCSAPFTYVREPAADLAKFLIHSVDDATLNSGLLDEVEKRCPGVFDDMTTLDERLRQELDAHSLSDEWNVMGNQAGQEVRNKESLLHFAAGLNLPLVIEFLMRQRGADVACATVDHNGLTPIQLAVSLGHHNATYALLGQVTSKRCQWKPLGDADGLNSSADGSACQLVLCHDQGALCVSSSRLSSSIDADVELLQEMASVRRKVRPLSSTLPPASLPLRSLSDGCTEQELGNIYLNRRTNKSEQYCSHSDKRRHSHHAKNYYHSNDSEDLGDWRPDHTVANSVGHHDDKVSSSRYIPVSHNSNHSQSIFIRKGEPSGETKQAIGENHRRLAEISEGIALLRQLNSLQENTGEVEEHQLKRGSRSTSCPSLSNVHREQVTARPLMYSSCLEEEQDFSDSDQQKFVDVTESDLDASSKSQPNIHCVTLDLHSIQQDAQNIINDVTMNEQQRYISRRDFDLSRSLDNLPDVALACELSAEQTRRNLCNSRFNETPETTPGRRKSRRQLMLSMPLQRSYSLSSLDEQEEGEGNTQLTNVPSRHGRDNGSNYTPTASPPLPAISAENHFTAFPSDMEDQEVPERSAPDAAASTDCDVTMECYDGNNDDVSGIEVVTSHSMAPADLRQRSTSSPLPHAPKSAPAATSQLCHPHNIHSKEPKRSSDGDNVTDEEKASQMDQTVEDEAAVNRLNSSAVTTQPGENDIQDEMSNELGEDLYGDDEDLVDSPFSPEAAADSSNDAKDERKRRASMFSKIGSYRQKKAGRDSKMAPSTHQFVSVSFSNSTACDMCEKSVANKPALQCENCLVNVHENSCQEMIPPCAKMKPPKSPQQPSPGTIELDADKKTNSLPGGAGQALKSSQSFKEKRAASVPSRTTLQISNSTSTLPQTASSSPSNGSHSTGSSGYFQWRRVATKLGLDKAINEESLTEKAKDDDGMCRIQLPESTNMVDGLSVSMESLDETSTDYVDIEDDPDLAIDPNEPEAWSVTVDKKALKKLSTKDIKRQDHIWEFIQTERRHQRTLQIMNKRFASGMRKEVNLSADMVERIFPRLAELLDIHQTFVTKLLERQQEKEDRSVDAIGDVIMKQFDGEMGERMKEAYGEFCSRHTEAVKVYKDLLKHERKFQAFIKKCRRFDNSKRFGVQECILLVTQRMTKYPLLLDAIIKTTHNESTEEKEHLNQAVSLARGILTYIDLQVDIYQRRQQLIEIYNKMDVRSHTLYRGRKFKKSDLLSSNRRLLHEGPVKMMSARGKWTEVKAVILSDVILFLLENNQKYSFFSPDNKGSAVPLSKLLVREKGANRDSKGLYLICRGQQEPEMYELVCNSVDDRKSWILKIKNAIEKCPDEADVSSDNEEERKKLFEARSIRLRDLINRLHDRDQEISKLCNEKMSTVCEVLEVVTGEYVMSPTRLSRDEATPEHLEQVIVKAATQLLSQLRVSRGASVSRSGSSASDNDTFQPVTVKTQRAETFGGYDNKNDNDRKNDMELSISEDEGPTERAFEFPPCAESSTDPPPPPPAQSQTKVFRRSSMIVNSFASEVEKPKERKLVRRMSTSLLPSLLNKRHLEKDEDTTRDRQESSEGESSAECTSSDAGIVMKHAIVGRNVSGAGWEGFPEQSMLITELQEGVHKLVALSSKRNTEIESLRAQLNDANVKLGLISAENGKMVPDRKHGSYQHDRQLEELRNLQESIQSEKTELEKQKEKHRQWVEREMENASSQQDAINKEKMDMKKKKEDLLWEKEALQRQIDLFEAQKSEFAEQKAQFNAQRDNFHLNMANLEGGLGAAPFLSAAGTHRGRERSASPMSKYAPTNFPPSVLDSVSHKRSASDDLQTSHSYQQATPHDHRKLSSSSNPGVLMSRPEQAPSRKTSSSLQPSESMRRDASLPAHLQLSAVNEGKVATTSAQQQLPHKLAVSSGSNLSSSSTRGVSPKHSASAIPVSSLNNGASAGSVLSPPPQQPQQFSTPKPTKSISPPKPQSTSISRQPSKSSVGANILPFKLAEGQRLPLQLAENAVKQRPKSAGNDSRTSVKHAVSVRNSSGSKGHTPVSHSLSDKSDDSKDKRMETKVFYL